MNTLIIKPQNKSDYELFVNLAKRLKVKYEEQVIDDDAPTKEEILNQIKEDYIALKNGLWFAWVIMVLRQRKTPAVQLNAINQYAEIRIGLFR